MRKFKKGDLIFHFRHGAGTVIRTQRLEMGGVEGLCYVVELVSGSMLMVPVKEAEELRLQPLIGPDAIRAVLADRPERMASDYRQRRGDIEAKVNSGDQTQTVEVLRDLVWREHSAHLSSGDKSLMDSVRKRLSQILAAQHDLGLDEASQLLDTMLKQTIVNPQ